MAVPWWQHWCDMLAAYWSLLLSGLSWTDVYFPSHGAPSRHGVQCSGVRNADYRLWQRRRCWHSKHRDCVEDVAAEACEHAHSRRDGFKPDWQWWWHFAVTVHRPAICHHSAPRVCSLCTPNSIPCTANRHVFNKQCRWSGTVSTWFAVTCRCPSSEQALICRTCICIVWSRADDWTSHWSLFVCPMFT